MTAETSLVLGRSGEQAAVEYLSRNKIRVVARSFRMFRCEIDIVARDGPTLVFIEVKTRRGTEFGLPEEAVSRAKQRRIRRVAEGYLLKHQLPEQTDCRFDVISLVPAGRAGFEVHHIKNAF